MVAQDLPESDEVRADEKLADEELAAEERDDGSAHLAPRLVGGLRRADARLVALVEQRPVAALSGALLFGYLVGRLVARRG
jgi:hypothetical protein